MNRRWLAGLALVSIHHVACGGRVNLGERREPEPDLDLSADVSPGAESSVGEPVAQLTPETRFDMLAVADDWLYVGNVGGVSRCQKTNCLPTLQALPGVGTEIASLQVYERSLGVVHGVAQPSWFALYSLPLGVDERVVVSDLPGNWDPLWHEGFVYFSLDGRVYRCALPGCEGGPETVGSYANLTVAGFGGPVADGQLVFYSDPSSIYRYEPGAGRAVALLADESLSEASNTTDVVPGPPAADFVESIAAADGKLYASIGHATSSNDCTESCTHDIVRWSVEGGARQTLVSSQKLIGSVLVFGGELVWVDTNARDDLDNASTLYSCLADACDATRRTLGHVVGTNATVVADDTDLYWFEAGPNLGYEPGAVRLGHNQIRRAARLSPRPDE